MLVPLKTSIERGRVNASIAGIVTPAVFEHAPFVQRPRTPAFHAGNTGSNPVRGTTAMLREPPPDSAGCRIIGSLAEWRTSGEGFVGSCLL